MTILFPQPCTLMAEPGMIARQYACEADAYDIVGWCDGKVFSCLWRGNLPKIHALVAIFRACPERFAVIGTFSL